MKLTANAWPFGIPLPWTGEPLGSALQIRFAGLDELLDYREDHGCGYAEEEHAVGGFEEAQELPAGAHDDIAVAERRVVDRRVVVGAAEVAEFPAQHE